MVKIVQITSFHGSLYALDSLGRLWQGIPAHDGYLEWRRDNSPLGDRWMQFE